MKLVLGAEYDQTLRDAVVEVLKRLGGQVVDKGWGVAGSQELETLDVDVGGEQLRVEAETYIGLSIEGSDALVERVKTLVDERVRKT